MLLLCYGDCIIKIDLLTYLVKEFDKVPHSLGASSIYPASADKVFFSTDFDSSDGPYTY